MSKAVVGQEWVDKYPDRFVGREPRSPGPCIICGAPDCTCTPEPETPDA